ncbi:chitin synthase-domain-containing protein, partial [Neohortaea acidophila]
MSTSPTAASTISPSTSDTTWPTRDIVYVGIVGTVMLAALLEWFLWLLAFLYCLVKVYQKASGKGRLGIRALAVFNIIFFVLMRCVFLPVMVVTLPLPPGIVRYFPRELIAILQWFAFYTFAALLTVPWLFCVFQLVTHNLGRRRQIKTLLDEHTAPKVVIILPCYNETPEILLRTVDSIANGDYPAPCLHVFLSFDGDEENKLYLNTIEQLGVPLTLESYPTSIDVRYRGCRVTVSRFKHGGKRSCQKKTFKLIDKVYADYLRRNDNLFLLFIDSDCILDRFCIQNFMYEMELRPGSNRSMLAMTGIITSTTVRHSLITLLQDMEYVHGQLFERSVESACGSVTCLPGALTILRFSAFRRMSKYYFADKAEQCADLFDYGKCHLGEDRWLTHLFMIGARHRYQIQLNTAAFCKTEAVQTFASLLKQRRRWFLGFITNEACMLTDIRLWRRYPLLILIRLAQNTIRTTALLFFIMVLSLLTTAESITNLPAGFIAVSLGLNWLLMLYFGAKLHRYKIWLYPLMFLLNPLLNWTYMVYGIFTASQRTWGGPRADAKKADASTTPEEAVEKAAKEGDELNVVPDTFKPALEASSHQMHAHTAPVQPARRLAGRFAPAPEIAAGWFRQENDSGV